MADKDFNQFHGFSPHLIISLAVQTDFCFIFFSKAPPVNCSLNFWENWSYSDGLLIYNIYVQNCPCFLLYNVQYCLCFPLGVSVLMHVLPKSYRLSIKYVSHETLSSVFLCSSVSYLNIKDYYFCPSSCPRDGR